MPIGPDYPALPNRDSIEDVSLHATEVYDVVAEVHCSDDPAIVTMAAMGLGKLLSLGYKPDDVLEMLGFAGGSHEV
jgi:hypothetical protein